MTDSSAKHASAFHGITAAKVRAMLAAVRDADVPVLSTVRRAYGDVASNFDETSAFLVYTGVLSQRDGRLMIAAPAWSSGSDDGRQFSTALMRLIAQAPSRYRTELFGYLREFAVRLGVPVYAPTPVLRGQHSDVRNFLMELGLLAYDAADDVYRLHGDAAPVYALAIEQHRAVSPEQLRARLSSQGELGSTAESEALAFEKQRVGERFADFVVYVAAQDTTAGYDIRSVSVCPDGKTTPRYIEVKAVSLVSLAFYWTRTEVNFARLAGDWYFLYLIPVGPGGRPDLSGMRILGNPYATVLAADSGWHVEEGVLRCCHTGEVRS